jgi:hypothetical protein
MRIALKEGEMPERPKGHDWKSCVPTKIGTEGSNPSLSAISLIMGVIGMRTLSPVFSGRIGFGDPEGGGGGSEATEHIPLSPPPYAKASGGKP